MKRKFLIIFTIIALITAFAFFILPRTKSNSFAITTTVQRGPFKILVYASGQLEAQNSENIVIPDILRDRDLRISEIKITDLIEEGTVVDSGDYVASLDHKAVEVLLITAQEELEQSMNELEDAKMDSNLTLSNNRDLITNAREDVEEMRIILDESIYESPAVIRRAEMDLDKAKRKLEQEIKGYDLKKRQATSQVERRILYLKQRQSRVDKLKDAYNSLDIKAPESGMLIYGRDRSREKIKIGSNVSPWSPIIAALPDLSAMHSITYVNEIDISRIKIGQKVTIGIDALPEKVLEGEVFSVANIGQPMPKSDAKVFEVKIRIFGEVTDLKPAMTTSNIIEAGLFSDTLFIPAEAVFENDSMQFVLFSDGDQSVKKVVDLGDKNENFILINQGVKESDVLLLTPPENTDDLPIEGIDLFYKIKERKAKEEEEINKTLGLANKTDGANNLTLGEGKKTKRKDVPKFEKSKNQ